MITIDKLKIIRKLIHNYVTQNKIVFIGNLTINCDIDIIELDDTKYKNYYGITHINAKKNGKWNKLKDVGLIADISNVTIDTIEIRFTKDDNQLSDSSIIHTFIHELAHSITPPILKPPNSIGKNILKLQSTQTKRKKLISVHHPIEFYLNYAKILGAVNKLGIYKLPSICPNLKPSTLQRYDSMINPADNMSLGIYTPI